ncbi:MAG: 4Fe-4S dicluster domain-containing protein [Clostridiales bacterium]|nr:4Fe-4S dicluster domain-containing protein [Clostridiales bacterium]
MELKKENLEKAMDALTHLGKVLAPSTVDEVKKFAPYMPGAQIDLDMVNTTLPPKDVLFPQTQKMYCFTMGPEASLEEIVESDEQILFGVRPCDVQSIDCLDKVFLTKTYTDSFYAAKRDKLTIIAIACTKAEPYCFCHSMGVEPDTAKIADILLTPTAAGWNVCCQSERGKAIIAAWDGLLAEEPGQALPTASPPLTVNMAGVAEKLSTMFEHAMWDELHHPCLGCGTCAFICPTCYCFEMGPELRGMAGTEMRYWDSCMFSEYTRMAGGHNPRPGIKERLRNRYMHKLTYFAERYGQNLCVGCGRCLEKCPVGLDISKVIEMIGEADCDERN